MKEINNGYFTGERSLFNSEDIKINNTIFTPMATTEI